MQKVVMIILLVYSCSTFSQKASADVTYGELISSLQLVINDKLAESEVLKREFSELQKLHGIADSQEMYHDFLRVRLAFEATRDSGLWQIRWNITHKEPNSDLIWAQWQTLQPANFFDEHQPQSTATAECDELSALFALIVRSLGVKEVGLFWPTSNHTVAVWMPKGIDGKRLRIVVPTSQIYLSEKATLGTKEFDPYTQKTIYQYRRKDVESDYKIPANVAKMMLDQVEKYGAETSTVLQEKRNALSRHLGGS